MLLRIGLDNGAEGRSLAYALDYPGCFAYGPEGSDAVLALPQAFLKYGAWVASHTPESWLAGLADFDVRLVSTWETYKINVQLASDAQGIYEVNAWFADDARPLSGEEIERGLRLLRWSRMDLLETVAGLTPDEMQVHRPEERWSTAGVLSHVANAEWRYLDCLGLVPDLPRADLPEDPFARLDCARARLTAALPGLAGSALVTSARGEQWSPRKLLRRAAWHEMDHIGHIWRLRLP
jgi:hypothetical protein